jgi:hypothetical protein
VGEGLGKPEYGRGPALTSFYVGRFWIEKKMKKTLGYF